MFRILIIDPNTPFRESLRKIINGRFPTIEIQEAAAGAEGLAKLNTFAPLLIFIDIYLPDKNGLDLARKIKASILKSSLLSLQDTILPNTRQQQMIPG